MCSRFKNCKLQLVKISIVIGHCASTVILVICHIDYSRFVNLNDKLLFKIKNYCLFSHLVFDFINDILCYFLRLNKTGFNRVYNSLLHQITFKYNHFYFILLLLERIFLYNWISVVFHNFIQRATSLSQPLLTWQP